jgi:hypothetical protein
MPKVSGFLKLYKRYSYKFTRGAVFHNRVSKRACFRSRVLLFLIPKLPPKYDQTQ